MIGNVIVGQSGGPTAVINSSLAGVFDAAKKAGCKRILGMLNGIEGLLNERVVDMSDYIHGNDEIELLKRTPSSYLGSCRYKLPSYEKDENVYKKIFEILKKLDVKHFFYIGGNDSMDTIKKLSQYAKTINSDITFMGVPKTIDNDLAATDHTPGYGSAAKYIASSMKEIILDSSVYPLDAVTIVEIMGRNAGWLTASAALAKTNEGIGPDLIYLPETPFSYEKFLDDIMEVKKRKPSIIVALSEGVRDENGTYINESQDAAIDAFGHKALGNTAIYLSDKVSKDTKAKSRGIVLSTLQRCASHIASKTDVDEAFEAGAMAFVSASNGETGKMAIFKRVSDNPYKIVVDTCDINDIANVERQVPKEWITDNGTNVSEEFVTYARPLIMGELPPIMENGVPKHIKSI